MQLIKNLLILLCTVSLMNCNSMKKEDKNLATAPVAKKIAKNLEAHGETRIDNYYWMRLTDEQKKAQNPDEQTKNVLDYLNKENQYLDAVMAHTKPLQDRLFEEIKGRIKPDDASVPYFKNGYWYYTRYEKEQEYPLYCRKKGSLDAAEQIMLNVNEQAAKYDFYNVGGMSVSPDNKLLAFTEDTLSRRIYTVRFIDLTTGALLKDEIPNAQGGIAWANDNKTVFYTEKNAVTLLSEKIMRHTLGTTFQDDVVVYHEKDPAYYIGVHRSKSGKYIIIYNSSTLVSDYQILSADDPEGKFRPFSPREIDMLYSIEHYHGKFYVLTNWDAKNFRLMETDEQHTSKESWQEVIGHRPDVLIENMEVFDNYLVLQERKNGLQGLRILNQSKGIDKYVDFDESAYTAYISTNPEFNSDWLRFGYSSLTTPNSIYDYNMNTGERILKKQDEVLGGYKADDYHTDRIFATARDGEKIPMTLVYKKGFVKDGNAPLLLYGYGSYGATIDPYFRASIISLLDRGFAFAIAHIRGGEMLGREWYENGKMLHKKNTFYDFIDCAKYLIDQQYTSREHIYAQGGSAGGLLMGAVLNFEPILFHGVIAAVPFVDVVTTMSDPSIPLTTNEYDEWGNPADSDSYAYMMTYSPYDNVKATDYTNILVTTGLFDSQVQYWEPAKWVAKLRELKTDDNRLLLHINMEAGHGGASGRYKRYKEYALEYAFLLDLEGITE